MAFARHYIPARRHGSIDTKFNETRRVHPLSANMSLSEAIALEADKLRDIRDRAKYIIDTSTYNAKPVRQDRIAFRRKTAKG